MNTLTIVEWYDESPSSGGFMIIMGNASSEPNPRAMASYDRVGERALALDVIRQQARSIAEVTGAEVKEELKS